MQYAGFWLRTAASFVDWAILVVVSAAVFAALDVGTAMLAANILTLIFFFGYFPAMEASARQATLGKSLVGIKVADMGGARTSFLRAFARNVAKIVSAIPFNIGFLLAAFTGRKQALHDMIASCVVIRGDKPAGFFKGLLMSIGSLIAAGAISAALVPDMTTLMGGSAQQAMKAAPTKPAPAKPAAVAKAPAPKPAAPVAAPKPAAAPVAPVAMTAAKPAAAPVEPAKPAAAALVKPAPAPEPVKTALVEQKPKAAAPEKPRPIAAPAKPAATPAPAPEPIAAPGPKFNDLMTAVLYRDTAAVNELLAFGKWPDKPDSRGTTPLTVAVMLGDGGSAEVLLKAGANPNLAMPAARERRDGAMAALLKRYGAR